MGGGRGGRRGEGMGGGTGVDHSGSWLGNNEGVFKATEQHIKNG